MNKIYEIKNLVVKYDNQPPTLKGLNLDIYENEIIVLIGSSGGGKTTLLRALNLLTEPSSGEIMFKGENLATNKNLNLLRAKIGMVFQNFNLFSNLTVLQNLILAPTKLKLLTKETAQAKALALLDEMNLAGFENKKVTTLSGGQKQRVAIARAMMVDPEIILFDEPTSALDPEMVGDVVSIIKQLHQKGIAMVIVTHAMKFASEVATRLIFMDQGVICEEGNPQELLTDPKSERLKQFLQKTLTS